MTEIPCYPQGLWRARGDMVSYFQFPKVYWKNKGKIKYSNDQINQEKILSTWKISGEWKLNGTDNIRNVKWLKNYYSVLFSTYKILQAQSSIARGGVVIHHQAWHAHAHSKHVWHLQIGQPFILARNWRALLGAKFLRLTEWIVLFNLEAFLCVFVNVNSLVENRFG